MKSIADLFRKVKTYYVKSSYLRSNKINVHLFANSTWLSLGSSFSEGTIYEVIQMLAWQAGFEVTA